MRLTAIAYATSSVVAFPNVLPRRCIVGQIGSFDPDYHFVGPQRSNFMRVVRHASSQDDDGSNDLSDEQQELNDIIMTSLKRNEGSDWVQAANFLKDAPTAPSPDLSPDLVANLVCRSLQWVDFPTQHAGLERIYDFLTWECRKCVTARRGADHLDRFVMYGELAPAFLPFMGASAVHVRVADATVTPAPQPPLRGALCSIPVTVVGAPVLTLQYASGHARPGIAATPPVTRMVIRLKQQRRPPRQGCWLVRELLDVKHAFAGDMGNAHVGG